MLEDTIAAISTPPGEGGIAIIRVSGSDAINKVEAIFQAPAKRTDCQPAQGISDDTGLDCG